MFLEMLHAKNNMDRQKDMAKLIGTFLQLSVANAPKTSLTALFSPTLNILVAVVVVLVNVIISVPQRSNGYLVFNN
jgi:hypothetical protein